MNRAVFPAVLSAFLAAGCAHRPLEPETHLLPVPHSDYRSPTPKNALEAKIVLTVKPYPGWSVIDGMYWHEETQSEADVLVELSKLRYPEAYDAEVARIESSMPVVFGEHIAYAGGMRKADLVYTAEDGTTEDGMFFMRRVWSVAGARYDVSMLVITAAKGSAKTEVFRQVFRMMQTAEIIDNPMLD